MTNYILCIYPLVLIILLVAGAKLAPRETFHEDFLSLKSTKVLQGAAAVGIILHHLVQEITDYGATWKGPITHLNWMGILFTSLFFFFSGYGLLKSFRTKAGYLDDFLEKRIPTVLIPLLISNILYFLYVGLYKGRIIRVTEAVTSLIGITLLNTNTWFLVEIIIFYLMFYILFKHIKNQDKALAAMIVFVITVIIVSLLLGHDHSEINGHWFMGEWWYNSTIVFVFGMLFARFKESIVGFAQKHYIWILPITILLFVGMYVLSENVVQNLGYYCEWEGYHGYKEKVITALVQSLTGALFVLMIVLFCMKVRFYNIIMAYVGKISLTLYIIHNLLMQNLLYMNPKIKDLRFFTVALFDSFVIGSALHFLVNQQLISLWRNYSEECQKEPETLEAKQKWEKRKKRGKKAKTIGFFVGTLLVAFMIKDAYDKYVVPGKNYEQQVEILASAQIGDIVYFGTYDIEPLITGERIEWIVLDRQDGKVLLVAKDGLKGAAFEKEYVATDWEKSTLRKMLNHDFVESAFTQKEQELLAVTKIITQANTRFGTEGGNVVYDKVFLLSVEEVEQYFGDDDSRKFLPTTMAHRNRMNFNPNEGSSWWWLRTMGKDVDMAAVVTVKGEISLDGERVNIVSGGVRPAMWIECE